MKMAVLDILEIGNPRLREPAREVSRDELESPEFQRLVEDLIETMRAAKGAGLAATQVGAPVRVCAIEVKQNPRYPYKPPIPLTVLINPTIEFLTDEVFENYEGCLSVPNLRGVVERSIGIRVQAWDRDGHAIQREVWGLSAGTYQHECDHLDGILFVDRVADSRTLCTWRAFEEHYRADFVRNVEALVARFGS